MGAVTVENSIKFPKKLKIESSCDLAIPFLGVCVCVCVYMEKMKSRS